MHARVSGYIVYWSEFILGVYTDIIVSCAHDVLDLCGIYMAFEGNICCWHIYDYSVIKLQFFFDLHVQYCGVYM